MHARPACEARCMPFTMRDAITSPPFSRLHMPLRRMRHAVSICHASLYVSLYIISIRLCTTAAKNLLPHHYQTGLDCHYIDFSCSRLVKWLVYFYYFPHIFRRFDMITPCMGFLAIDFDVFLLIDSSPAPLICAPAGTPPPASHDTGISRHHHEPRVEFQTPPAMLEAAGAILSISVPADITIIVRTSSSPPPPFLHDFPPRFSACARSLFPLTARRVSLHYLAPRAYPGDGRRHQEPFFFFFFFFFTRSLLRGILVVE